MLVATLGISALLLPRGRTTHSKFHVPLDPKEGSTFSIEQCIELVELILRTSLIIWDGASMANKYCPEILDKTLRNIIRVADEKNNNRPFKRLIVVLGGDFS